MIMIMPTYSIQDSMTQVTGYPKSSVPGVSVRKSVILLFLLTAEFSLFFDTMPTIKRCSVLFTNLYYTPVEDGTYYVITRGGRAGGWRPHSLSRAYLQDYASYGYETSWVDRSHQGRVQCTGTVTLACLIFELLPFVYFHTSILYRAYLQNYTSRTRTSGVICSRI